MYRWTLLALAGLTLLGFVLAETNRREAVELRAELEALASEVSADERESLTGSQVSAGAAAPDSDTEDALVPQQSADQPQESVQPGAPLRDPMAVIAALSSSADKAERERLAQRLMRSPEPAVRLAGIAELLEQSPSEGVLAVRELVTALDPQARTNSWGVAETAILALAEVDGAGASGELYELFESEERMLNIPAARALELRGDISPMQALSRQLAQDLSSENEATRIRAATDLGRTRSGLAIGALRAGLGDPSSEVRIRSVRSLERIGTPESVTALGAALQDPSPGVAQAAEQALQRLRQQP